MSSLAVKLPITRDVVDGFEMIDDFESLIRQNLKMLVLTAPGERVMEPEFGVGVRKYLFENFTNTTASRISSKIREQVRIYMPAVKISNITVDTSSQDTNTLAVILKYSVAGITTNDLLQITI